ncbi:UNVERIFIED_ORG: hypothetical protein GGI63_000879 [Rhizobium esperanzae]
MLHSSRLRIARLLKKNTPPHFSGVNDDFVWGAALASERTADELLVVGEDGTVLIGNARDGFRSLGEFFPGDYIWSVRSFLGRIYLGTCLYVLEGSRVRLLTGEKLDGKTQVISLDSVSDNALWIATNRHAYRYDGSAFTYYQHGDNLAY